MKTLFIQVVIATAIALFIVKVADAADVRLDPPDVPCYRFTWTPAPGPVDFYEVEVWKVRNAWFDERVNLLFAGTGATKCLKLGEHVPSQQRITVRVRARNGSAAGPWSRESRTWRWRIRQWNADAAPDVDPATPPPPPDEEEDDEP